MQYLTLLLPCSFLVGDGRTFVPAGNSGAIHCARPDAARILWIVVNEVKCACLVTFSDLLLDLFAYLIFALFWPVFVLMCVRTREWESASCGGCLPSQHTSSNACFNTNIVSA